jgi:3-phosphoshikimate 1-carboxyvinyltransferase
MNTPGATIEALRYVESELAGVRDALVRADRRTLHTIWEEARNWRMRAESPGTVAITTVDGDFTIPGDKSISHRALIMAALSTGSTRITGILESADVRSTAGVLRELGVDVPELGPDITVQGVGLRGLREPSVPLDCGNSGTTTRLMAGVVAGSGVSAKFIGDESLSGRPMRRIARPLEAMGARLELPSHGGLPMVVHGAELRGIEWESEVASGQVKSAVLLAALVAGVEAKISEPVRSRDHTERMLMARGAELRITETTVALAPVRELIAVDQEVPGDPSSAAFIAALAALADRGRVRIRNVCMNETRAGFLRLIHQMGGHVMRVDERICGGEIVADVVVGGGTQLGGVDVGGDEIPSMIDELPLLACLATRAEGTTRITGAEELRVKESDRITAVVTNLSVIGADAEELPDGMVVRGSRRPLRGRVVTHGDHRLAMAFGVLGALAGNDIEIDDRDCVNVSFPGFWDVLARVVKL